MVNVFNVAAVVICLTDAFLSNIQQMEKVIVLYIKFVPLVAVNIQEPIRNL